RQDQAGVQAEYARPQTEGRFNPDRSGTVGHGAARRFRHAGADYPDVGYVRTGRAGECGQAFLDLTGEVPGDVLRGWVQPVEGWGGVEVAVVEWSDNTLDKPLQGMKVDEQAVG